MIATRPRTRREREEGSRELEPNQLPSPRSRLPFSLPLPFTPSSVRYGRLRRRSVESRPNGVQAIRTDSLACAVCVPKRRRSVSSLPPPMSFVPRAHLLIYPSVLSIFLLHLACDLYPSPPYDLSLCYQCLRSCLTLGRTPQEPDTRARTCPSVSSRQPTATSMDLRHKGLKERPRVARCESTLSARREQTAGGTAWRLEA